MERMQSRSPSSQNPTDNRAEPSGQTDNQQPIKATGLLPDYFAESISVIDFAALQRRGVRHLVVDVDHTLAVYRSLELEPETVEFLQSIQRAGLVTSITIASNSRRDLQAMAESIGAAIVRPYFLRRKPSQAYYRKLIRTIGCCPEEAVMVGDKMINDIWGGNRLGMYTVLVNPIGPDMLFDRLVGRRFWGRRYVRQHQSAKFKRLP